MLKLIKYEFRKTLSAKLIVLGLAAALEAAFLAALYASQGGSFLIITCLLLTLLASCGVLAIGVNSVSVLHRDMNTRQGYMLFMTPHSCYRILGAKMLEASLSVFAAGTFFFALGALDVTLLFAKMGELDQLRKMFMDLLHSISDSIRLDTADLAAFSFNLLAGWISVIATAFLADVVSAALLNGKKHNGLLSFALFLALSLIIGWITGKVTSGMDSFIARLLTDGALSLLLAGIMYAATARIMDRRLSV